MLGKGIPYDTARISGGVSTQAPVDPEIVTCAMASSVTTYRARLSASPAEFRTRWRSPPPNARAYMPDPVSMRRSPTTEWDVAFIILDDMMAQEWRLFDEYRAG